MFYPIKSKGEALFSAINRIEGRSLENRILFHGYSQHWAAYALNLTLITAGVAALVFAGMAHWKGPLMRNLTALNREYATIVLVISGGLLFLFPTLALLLRLKDRGLLIEYEKTDLEDPSIRAQADIGIPTKRGGDVECYFGTVERDDCIVHYMVDWNRVSEPCTTHITGSWKFELKSMDPTGLFNQFKSTCSSWQLVIEYPDRYVCYNYGDNIAFLKNGNQLVALSEAQSNNFFYKEGWKVMETEIDKFEGNELVMGSRYSLRSTEEVMKQRQHRDGEIYAYTTAQIAEKVGGRLIGGR